MAPTYDKTYDTSPTRVYIPGVTYYASNYYVEPKPVETKEQKTKRIAEEKMYASWKIYDQKTPTINKIKQECKPQHRMSYVVGRRMYH